MACGNINPREIARSITGEDLKNLLRKGITGYTKSVDINLTSKSPTKKTVGISKSDTSSSLDEILVNETCEILNRASKEISGYSGKIDSETLDMVVEIFVSRTSNLLQKISDIEPGDSFACTFCWELLHDPVTLQCGHTFCKTCLSSHPRCKECKTEIDSRARHSGNVVLATVLQKLYSMEYVARSLTVEGDEMMKKSLFEQAVSKYIDAAEFGIQSAATLAGRAKAFQSLGNHECATQDAMSIPTFKRNSFESLMTKGEVLLAENKDIESLMCFLSCLTIDSSNPKSLDHTKSILDKLLSKNFSIYDPSAKRIKLSDSAASSCSHHESSPNDSGMLLETLLCCLLRDIDNSLLSETNLTNYFENEGKGNKEMLSHARPLDKSLVDATDFECSLCMMLFLNPVCTPCGHTFCRDCLERTVDHGHECPLCKRPVSLNIEKQKRFSPSLDMCLASIIRQALPNEYQERLELHEKEVETLRTSTPIFVCTLAYPSMPCPLHIFEPRYRLLLRRALDIHDRKFGIVLPAEDKPFQEVGTIVKIKNVSFFPDGRSVVESEGCARFKTIETGMKDGYNTAKVEYLVDTPVTCPKELETLERICILVYDGSKSWYEGVNSVCKERIKLHYGNFPNRDVNLGSNGPHWLWWVLAVLPVDHKIKNTVLSKTELKQRLLLIHKILKLLQKPRPT